MKVEQCRVCQGRSLQPFLDLGRTALANSFLLPDETALDEPKFPLRVVLCADCGLVQIDEEVPAEVLFKNYIYVSGTSDLIRTHAAFLAGKYTGQFGLKKGDLMLEAASNDGTVLKAFQKHGIHTVGIEPAQNIAMKAHQDGVETVCEFFNKASAEKVRDRYGPAKLILARHVLAHVADLHGFVQGFPIVLAPDGLAAVEFPHLLPFHDKLEYDTVYHEHLCYFSVRVVKQLFERFGMEIIDVQEVAIHGGSVVVTAQLYGGPRMPSASVQQIINREEKAGLHRLKPWLTFARQVEESKALLLQEIDRLQKSGKTLAGYGAPAKGMTLLSYCGIGAKQIPYLVDKSPFKHFQMTPGHHIPVYPTDKLLRSKPDVVLVLAWNFAQEIARQQTEYRARGGRLLLPIPTAHYWTETQVLAA